MAKNSYAVFGMGSFGSKLAEALSKEGNTVLICDVDSARIDDMRDKVTEAVIGDVGSEEIVRELNVSKFDAVILGMSSHFETQVLALTLLKQEGARKVVVKAHSAIQERILRRLGADAVIQPEEEIAEKLALQLSLNISKFYEFRGFAIAEAAIPAYLDGQSLRKLDLRNRFGITVLLFRRPGENRAAAAGPGTVLEKGGALTVFGSKEAIIEFFKEK